MATVTVKPGDTLSQILKNAGNPNYASPSEWAKYTSTPNSIRPGQQFNIPTNSVSQNRSNPVYNPVTQYTQPISSVASQPGWNAMQSRPGDNFNPTTSQSPIANSIAQYFKPNTFGGISIPSTGNSNLQPMASNQSPQSGFRFPNLISTAYASDTSMPASPKIPMIPDSVNPERTGEVPSDTIDRTHVTHGTPAWVVPILQKVSRKYNIPTAILSAVARQESGFNPSIRQPDGLGRGLFQLDLGQHKDVTEAEAFDPNFAADYAAKLLREGFDRTGTWAGALRYYNGGPNYNSNNPGYQGQPISQLTQNYANNVLGYSQDTIPVQDQEYQKKIDKSLGR